MTTLPLWAQAAIWGTFAGSGLLFGLLAAYITPPGAASGEGALHGA
jgi:hypothetical protein